MDVVEFAVVCVGAWIEGNGKVEHEEDDGTTGLSGLDRPYELRNEALNDLTSLNASIRPSGVTIYSNHGSRQRSTQANQRPNFVETT